jgi:hypothetical protein
VKYDEALKLWGKAKIEEQNGQWVTPREVDIDPASVSVSMDFNAGFACCGGSDPDCYCSFAESPSAQVKIWGEDRNTMQGFYATIDADCFDFATVLGEIVEAADGCVSKS